MTRFRDDAEATLVRAALANKEWQAEHLRELTAQIPRGVYPLSTKEGARAHVVRMWGLEVLECGVRGLGWDSPLMAVVRAQQLLELKARRARLSRAEEHLVSDIRRKYGPEIIYQRALNEAALSDPQLARVITARTSYLLAAAEGIAALPQNEIELRTAESRWERRWSKKLQQLRRSLRVEKTRDSPG